MIWVAAGAARCGPRLGKFLRTSPEFWMNMQAGYDLKIEAVAKKGEIARIQAMKAA